MTQIKKKSQKIFTRNLQEKKKEFQKETQSTVMQHKKTINPPKDKNFKPFIQTDNKEQNSYNAFLQTDNKHEKIF